MVKTTEFNIQTQMNYVVGNMSGFTAAYTGMNNLSALISSLMTSYTTMAGTGRAAYLSLGAAAAAFGLKSAEAFGEYQRGMNMVKAISNNTNAQMQMLAKSAGDFSSQFRMGIEDINSGLVTLGRAGLTDVNNQIQVLQNGLEVAKISGMDLASTLEDIVTTTSLLGGDIKSNTFGAETKEVSNLLVATSLSGPLNVSDVIETLKFAGGSAAAAGATLSNEEGLHDLLGTIGAFSQKGVTGSIAGTALRAFITKPASQDQKVSDALAKLGLDAYSLWEKDPEQGWHMKPIAEQIGMITKAMDKNHLTNLDRIEVWGDIVGNKMGQQMLKLDENRIKETTKDIEHQRNLEDIYQGTLTNFASQVERLNQVLQAIYRNLGSGFANNLTPIVKGLADFLEFINGILNGTVFKFLASIIGPLGLAGLAKGLQDVALVVREFKQNIKASQMTPILEQDLWKGAWGIDVKQLQKIVDREHRDRAYEDRLKNKDSFDKEGSDEYWKRWETHQDKRDKIYYDKLNTPDPAYDARQEKHLAERNRLYMQMMERVEAQKVSDYRKRTEAMQKLRSQSVRADVVNLRAQTLNVGQNIDNAVTSSIEKSSQNMAKKVNSTKGMIIPGTTATRVSRYGSVRAMEDINLAYDEGGVYTGKALQRILDTEGGVRALHEVGNSLSWDEMIDSDGNHILTDKASELFTNAARLALDKIEPGIAKNLSSWYVDAVFDDMADEMIESENEYYQNFFDENGNVKSNMQERFMQELLKKAIGTLYYDNANSISLEELGYSKQQAKDRLGIEGQDKISYRQLVRAGDGKAFNLAPFVNKENFVAEQNPDLPLGVLEKISDRMIFNSMGLVSQHGRVGHTMASILGGLGDGVNDELSDTRKSIQTWSKTLIAESGNSARKIVKAFLVDGFHRRSPGDIAHGTNDEFEDALKFIKKAAEKLTEAAFKVGESIAQSFIKGIKQNSLLRVIQKQFESIQILLTEQQTVLSSLMHMVARDSVLNFSMGFNSPGLVSLMQTEFALVMQEAVLFGEKLYAGMFRAGFLAQQGYKDGAGIHSPGYIYIATDEEFTAVNLLLDQEARIFGAKGQGLGQALTEWVNHLNTTEKVADQMAFGEFLAKSRHANHDYITGGNGLIGVGGTLNYIRPETAQALLAEQENDNFEPSIRRMDDEFKILPSNKFFESKNAIYGLDFETTSVNVTQSMKGYLPQIVEAGFAMVNEANEVVTSSISDFLIRSKEKMTYGAKMTTGLDEDKLDKFGVSESEGYKTIVQNIISNYDEVQEMLLGPKGAELYLAAHNASFDRNVLLHNLARLSYKSEAEGGLADTMFKTRSGGEISLDEAIGVIDNATWVDPDVYAEEYQYDKIPANDGINLFYRINEKLHKVAGAHTNEALGRVYEHEVEERRKDAKAAGEIKESFERKFHSAGFDTEVMAHVIKNFRETVSLGQSKVTKLFKDAWEASTPKDLATLDSDRRQELKEAGYTGSDIVLRKQEPRGRPRKHSRETFDAGSYVVVSDGKHVWAEPKPQLKVRGDYGELIEQDEGFEKAFNPYNKHDMNAEGEKELTKFYKQMDKFISDLVYDDDFSRDKTTKNTERFNRKFNETLNNAFKKDKVRKEWGDKFNLQTKALLLGENESETIAKFDKFLSDEHIDIPDKSVYDYLPRIDTPNGKVMTLNPLGYAVTLMNNNTKLSQKALESMQTHWDEMGKFNESIIRALGGYDQVGIDVLGSYGDLSVIDYQNMHNKGPYSDILQSRISGHFGKWGHKYYGRTPGGYFDALTDSDQKAYGSNVLEYQKAIDEGLFNLTYDYGVDEDGFWFYHSDFERLLTHPERDFLRGFGLDASLADYWDDTDVFTESAIKKMNAKQNEYLKNAIKGNLSDEEINKRRYAYNEKYYADVPPLEDFFKYNNRSLTRTLGLIEDIYGLKPSQLQGHGGILGPQEWEDFDDALKRQVISEVINPNDIVNTETSQKIIKEAFDYVNDHAEQYEDKLNNMKKAAFDRYWNDQNSTEIPTFNKKGKQITGHITSVDDYEGKSTMVLKPRFYDRAANFFDRLVNGSPEVRDDDGELIHEAIPPQKNPLSYMMNKVNNLLGYKFWNYDDIADIHMTGTSSIASKSKNKFYQYTADQLQVMGNRIEEEFLNTFKEGVVYYSGSYQGIPNSSYHTIDKLPIFRDLLKAYRQQTEKPYEFLKDTNPDTARDTVDKVLNEGSEKEIQTMMTRHLEEASSAKFASKMFKTKMGEIVRTALTDIHVDVDKLGLPDRQRRIRKYSKQELEENQAWEDHKIKGLANDAIDKFGSNTKFQTEKGAFNKYLEKVAAKNKVDVHKITQAIIDEEPKTLKAMVALGMTVPEGWNKGSDSNSPPKVLTQFIQYLAEVPIKINEQAGPLYTAMYEWGLSFVRGVKAGTQMASPPKVLRELIAYLQSTEDATQLSVSKISRLILSLREEMTADDSMFIMSDGLEYRLNKQLGRTDLQGNRFGSLREALTDAKELSTHNRNIAPGIQLLDKQAQIEKQRGIENRNSAALRKEQIEGELQAQLGIAQEIQRRQKWNERAPFIESFEQQLSSGRFDNHKITEEMMESIGLKAAAEKAKIPTNQGYTSKEYHARVQEIFDAIEAGTYTTYNEIMLDLAKANQARKEGIALEQEQIRLQRMQNREEKYGLAGKVLNKIGTGIPATMGKIAGGIGKGLSGVMSLMMNPYIMGAEMLWGFIQQAIDILKQQEQEKIAKLSEITSEAESAFDEQQSKWEEAQSKDNEKFGDLSDNEKQDKMLDAIAQGREDFNNATAETKALIGKQNELISANNNLIDQKMSNGITGYNGLEANYTEFMEGSGMYGTKDEFGFMDFLGSILDPNKLTDNSNTRRLDALTESDIQIDTRVKNMEEFTEDYQQVMASMGLAHRSLLDIYNVRGIMQESELSGTFFDQSTSNAMRIGSPTLMSPEKLAGIMKQQEKILRRFENRYLRFMKAGTGKDRHIEVTLGDGSIHKLAQQLGLKDIEAAQVLAVHQLQRIQDVMINQVEPQLAQQTLGIYQNTYQLDDVNKESDVQSVFQNTMTKGILAIQMQVAQLVYKAAMEQALQDYQAETGDTETNTVGLLLNKARDTTAENHELAKKYSARGWGSYLQSRDINALVNQGYTEEQAIQKLAQEKGVSVDQLTNAYAQSSYDELGKYDYNGTERWLKNNATWLIPAAMAVVGGAAGTVLGPIGTVGGAELGSGVGAAALAAMGLSEGVTIGATGTALVGGAAGLGAGVIGSAIGGSAAQAFSDGLTDFSDPFTEHTNEMMRSYANSIPLDSTIDSLNDAQTAADSEGDNGKDTDTSDADKQRYVQLAICNKKAIPKLNVNLFKKAPTFTVLNKNFKLRDIKINTADKAKNIENSLKNAIIDVQERSDPKIIQDSEAEYDPVGATDDATNLPTGASLTK